MKERLAKLKAWATTHKWWLLGALLAVAAAGVAAWLTHRHQGAGRSVLSNATTGMPATGSAAQASQSVPAQSEASLPPMPATLAAELAALEASAPRTIAAARHMESQATATPTAAQTVSASPVIPIGVPAAEVALVRQETATAYRNQAVPVSYPYASYAASQAAINAYVQANPGKALPANLSLLREMGY